MHATLFLGLPLLLLSPVFAFASETCDVRVLVRDPGGAPVEVAVVASTPEGSLIAKAKSSSEGVAELCDVGLQPFSVTVGDAFCGQVTLHHLETRWPDTLVLPVIIQNCHRQRIFAACTILLRVVDEQGARVQGALLRIDDAEAAGLRSDSLGRIRTGAKYQTRHRFTVIKAEMRSGAIELVCSDENPNLEGTVVLRR